MLGNTDLTLFYCRKEAGKDIYRRVFLRGVHWEASKQSNIVRSGATVSDSVWISIPLEALENAEKEYMLPRTYALSPDGDFYFTIEANSKNMVVRGIIEYQIDNSSERSIGESKKYLQDHFDDVVTIQTVDPFLFGSRNMRHIEVSCK